MPLSGFDVVQEHSHQDQVLVQCFDGAQTVLVFISHRDIAIYFRRYDLTPREGNLLISSNMEKLVPVISGRHERGAVSTYESPTGRVYPRIDLTTTDMGQASEKLTDSILDIYARAGFQTSVPFALDVPGAGLDQAVWSGPPQNSLTPPVAGVANEGLYADVSYTAVSAAFTQPGSQNTRLPLAEAGSDRGSTLEPIPPQGAGPHFTIGATGLIALASPSQLDAAGNDIGRIRQFLPLVRRAADDLVAALNSNQFTLLSRNLADYRAAIAANATEIAWGLVFGLGVRLANAAGAAQRQIEDRLLPALEDPAQEALQSLTTLHGALIMATAEGRELEEQADQLEMTREQQTAFRDDAVAIAAELHRAAEVIEPQADKIVTEAAEVIGEGLRGERGTVFGIATLKHVTTVLVSAATVAVFGAAVGSELGTVFGGAAGRAAGTAFTWLGLETLKTRSGFKAATAALGEGYDRLLREVEEPRLRQRLIQLAPFRQFVTDNQEPLRRIANDTRQMRWMLPYIDFIVRSDETKKSGPRLGPTSDEVATGALIKAGDQVDVTVTGKTVGPARVLDANIDQILAEAAREVARIFPEQRGIYIAPHIPAAKEANARASTGIPQNEVVWILFDYTARGSATNCLIAGESGIFHHHTLADPNLCLISYRKLRDAQIVNKFTGVEIRCSDQPKLELDFSPSNKQASRRFLRALQVRLKAVPC